MSAVSLAHSMLGARSVGTWSGADVPIAASSGGFVEAETLRQEALGCGTGVAILCLAGFGPG